MLRLSSIVTAIVLLTAPAPASDRPGVVVMDLVAVHEVEQSLADILNDSLVARLKSTKRFGSILSGSDMRAMLNLEQQKQALNCDDQSCLAEIGGALGVPYLVHANLGRVGASYLLSIKIMDVNGAKVAGSHVQRLKSEDDLLDGIDGAVDKAVAEVFPEPVAVATKPPAPTKAVPQKASGPPTATPKATGSRRSLTPTLLLASGGLAVGGGLLVMAQAQSSFDQSHETQEVTNQSLDTLESQFRLGNIVLGTGVAAVSLGVLAKVYLP